MTLKARITAIDRFITGCREDGIYDDLNACCVMAGWDSLAGALTPLKGAAPTNANFLNADLDRGIGLKGNGSSKYLDSNRNNNADGQDDAHRAVWVSNAATSTASGPATYPVYVGTGAFNGSDNVGRLQSNSNNFFHRSRSLTQTFTPGAASVTGLLGTNRDSSSGYTLRISGVDNAISVASQTPLSSSLNVYKATADNITYSNATIAFYSIGSATDLALLDARVSTLMADLRAIEEAGFDRDAIAYIRAVEEADGAYLETSVKTAINNLVSGLKSDGLWESMASTCLLSGPRTLAGALVPLRGDAPTAEGGWASGDYDRATGLTGDPTASLYLNSNRANNADPQNDAHLSVYLTSPVTSGGVYGLIGTGQSTPLASHVVGINSIDSAFFRSNAPTSLDIVSAGQSTGLYGVTRNSASLFSVRVQGSSSSLAETSVTPASLNSYVFARNNNGTAGNFSDPTIAFYSIGTSLDLAKLDSHITAYVTAIGAAV